MGQIIDLTALFPWRILMLFAYSFAYYNISHSVLKDKINPLLTLSSIFALRVVLSVAFFHSVTLNALGFPVFLILSFVLICFLTEGKIGNKIIVTLFYFISHFFTTIILSMLMGLIFDGKGYDEIFGFENPNLDYLYLFIVKVVCYISVSFLFSGLLKLFAAKKSKQKHKRLYAYLSFFPFSHIFILFIALFLEFGGDGGDSNYGITVNVLVYLLMGAILIFDCSFPFVADYFEKMEESYAESKKELLMSNLKYEQTKFVKEEIQEIHKVKHDYLNITSTALQFLENNETQKAIDILNKTNEDLNSTSKFYICSNKTLNTIMYIKQRLADELDVELSIDITEKAELNIDDYSVCRIVHNILDNAINAASKACEKRVCVIISITPDTFILECENLFDENKKANKPRKGHGYGIGIVKEIVKSHNGKFEAQASSNIYNTKITLPNEIISKQ